MGFQPKDYNKARELVSLEYQATIRAKVNGEERVFAEGATLVDVLSQLALHPERVAIELDRKIVKRGEWAATGVREGSEMEIVMFVGGG